MNGIILINKPTGYTSRDIVNIVGKKLSTKKIGHTGTLDPLAAGVLVLCVGKYTKLVDLITSYDKEYIAEVILGLETDTLDIEGNIINDIDVNGIDKDKIIETLNHFKGTYLQEVPKYSAVKINGKKMYEYARNNIEIELPKREVTIKEIELIDDMKLENNKIVFKIKTCVSKGTYIRSLIRDIGAYLNVPATMKSLIRTKQGEFKLEECNELNGEYKILDIKDVLDLPTIEVTNEKLRKQILNGAKIDNIYNYEMVMFKINDEIVGIYKKDNNKLKAYKMFT